MFRNCDAGMNQYCSTFVLCAPLAAGLSRGVRDFFFRAVVAA